MTLIKRAIPAASLLISVALGGCGSFWNVGEDHYDCPGIPQGVVCKTPRQVYELTNHHDALVTMESDGKQKGNPGIEDAKPTGVLAQGAAVRLPQPIQQPMPILEPAQVMRIWVNSWIDQNGDLHYPGLLFTEITPRRWAQGNIESGVGARMLVPIQIDGDRDDASASLAGGANTQSGVIQKPSSVIQPYGKQPFGGSAQANNRTGQNGQSNLPLGLPTPTK